MNSGKGHSRQLIKPTAPARNTLTVLPPHLAVAYFVLVRRHELAGHELELVRFRVARLSPRKRIANLGEFNVWLEICLRYLYPHNTRQIVARTDNPRDHKAVSVRNERRKWKADSTWRMYADGSFTDSV